MQKTEIRRTFPPGAKIFNEGAPGDCAYIIESGEIEISIRRDDRDLVLARRGVGEIFGEMAIIDAAPRSASARAVVETTMLLLTEAQLQNRMKHLDPVLRMVLGVVLERFRASMQSMRSDAPAAKTAPSDGADAGDEDGPQDENLFSAAIQQVELEQELRRGIADGQIVFFYQPLIDSDDQRVMGYEALARWNHPERGMLPPGAFIQVAEASGLVRQISRCAVEAACRAAARLRAAPDGAHLFISANVTAEDICDPAFFDHVALCLELAGLAPDGLFLELTETTLIENADQALEMLGRYRALGVGVSIDDFGAGYSNFGYLARYPVQCLKIDKSVVDQVSCDAAVRDDCKGGKLVRIIATMAEVLGLKIVAEGVETAEQALILRDLGCHQLQGYHFGKPAPLVFADLDGDSAPAAVSR